MLDQRAAAFAPEALAQIGGATVLPHDRIADRYPGLAIPHDCSLTLICNADGRDVTRSRAGLGQGLHSHCDLRQGNLFRIVLDPSRLGKNLIEFPLGLRANHSFAIKQQGARTGCALVQS